MKETPISLINRGLQIIKQDGFLEFFRKVFLTTRKAFTPLPLDKRQEINLQKSFNDLYLDWIERNEPAADELKHQKQLSENFSYKPLISILVPVYNPEPQFLEQSISSVLAQTYSEWELCLVDGASSHAMVQDTLNEFARKDARIHLKFLPANQGISGNTNEAIQMAQGEFAVFLDQDDVLAPFALFEVVKTLNQEPNWDLLYSDHDLLSYDGSQRRHPLFKPDWSPEIMLSANYITHLTVARTSLVREAGGFDSQMDGAQDWDLFLKISERTQKIAHIPKILYHWRDSSTSTASNIWVKDYAPQAQLRAISNHLIRQGLPNARAFFDQSGYIRVSWQFDREKKVSIIIPSNGANTLLETCITSLLRQTDYPNYEVIIVNNGPKRPEEFSYYRRISADERVRVIHYDRPFNYSAVNNFGARHANGEILLFLNNDTEVFTPDWLDELVMWIERQHIGIVGAKLLLPDGTIQHAGVIIGLTGFAGHIFGGQPEYQWTTFGLAEWYRDYKAVTAACLIIRREVFEQIGGFDEDFILCGNDVEICLRAARAGLRVVYNPFARLRHLEGATRSGDVPEKDFHTSYPHYLPTLQSGDPYFNPGLSYWQLKPTLAAADEQSPLDFVLKFLKTKRGINLNVADE